VQEKDKHIKQLEEENAILKKENEELKEKCKDLEKRLRVYENPHIPSSKQIMNVVGVVRTPKKRGAPEGHKGFTRKRPVPDQVIELKPERCPRCDNKRIMMLKKHRKIIEDIQIVKVVTEFHYYDCVCEKCGKKFMTTSEDIPKQGRFGPNILSLWAILHYIGTIPFDRLSTISRNCFTMNISTAGIHNVIYRTAGIFEPNFNRFWNRLAKAKYVKSDETAYSFNGKRYWLWNISTVKDVLVLIRNNRGAKVLKEVFGDFLDGILNSDCLRTYDRFKVREYQKCWAHVLRDAKDLAKHSIEGTWLYEMLSHMHKYINKVKDNSDENTLKVKQWIWRTKKEMDSWLDKNYESKAVQNLILRMAKYKDHWFTCLRYPFVEPTNNGSERDIRKNVIAKKISGLHRSKLGLHSREIMMSTILTLEKRDQSPFDFVLNGIKKYNLRYNVS
jgi:transposase